MWNVFWICHQQTPFFRRPLAELSKHLLCIRMELLDYRLKIFYIPGRKQSIEDALSRYPTSEKIWSFLDPSTEWCSPHNKVSCNYSVCYNSIDSDDPILDRFYDAAENDEEYKKISN